MNAEPTPDVCRAAALGCFVAAFMATQLGYAQVAASLVEIAGALLAYALILGRRAARQPVVRPPEVFVVPARPRVFVVPLAAAGTLGSAAAGRVVISGSAG